MAYIHRTNGTATNELIWTLSMWVKQSDPEWGAMLAGAAGATNTPEFSITGADVLQFWTASATAYLATTAKYRDPSAWRHIVIAVDTTQGTPADRIKMYVNGEEPALTTATYPSASYNSELNKSGEVIEIGKTGPNPLNGVLSHVHFIDGIQYTASTFGETDATSGIWKIKTSPTVTYGNNGFFLKMEDRTNLDLDSSPNAHTMTTSGTITATYDNPSNNFCTWNPLDNYRQGAAFAYGNTQFTTTTTAESWNSGTLGVASGKWYWEVQGDMFGIAGLMTDGNTGTYYLGNKTDTWGYYVDGKLWNSGSGTAWGATHNTTDIMAVALDLDNNFLYLAKNNVWQNSGVPTSGATGTGAITVIAPSSGFYYPANGDYGGSAVICTGNFGNGYFGTTAVTSAEADGAGIGAFEYAPPTGYYALCTKNIKAYGG